MPTASEFEQSALELDRAAEDTESLVAGARELFGENVLSGGGLSRLVESTIDVTERTTTSTAAELRELANECRSRASECRAYAAELAAYNEQLEAWQRERNALPPGVAPPRRPTRPSRPASWVEI